MSWEPRGAAKPSIDRWVSTQSQVQSWSWRGRSICFHASKRLHSCNLQAWRTQHYLCKLCILAYMIWGLLTGERLSICTQAAAALLRENAYLVAQTVSFLLAISYLEMEERNHCKMQKRHPQKRRALEDESNHGFEFVDLCPYLPVHLHSDLADGRLQVVLQKAQIRQRVLLSLVNLHESNARKETREP